MATIINFNPAYRSAIKTLNIEWLEKHFSVEPLDLIQLSDPENEIILKGGHIYYAKMNNAIVGTATLLKIDEFTFELGKMAVTENAQGNGIGNKLIEHCLQKAKELGAKKVILFSNTKLIPAINLYKKYGFKECEFNNSHYKRSNIKMELCLT
ncbi:MAG: GNAT family N-acetyltransferase [Saprospiraceae bacterium]|nr:GNAT family N-acetyltransferase [Saprospiraceae bacterium]MBK9721817.1 GNAT family N-acetyltransferase [Saprospiraceae bacterium]